MEIANAATVKAQPELLDSDNHDNHPSSETFNWRLGLAQKQQVIRSVGSANDY